MLIKLDSGDYVNTAFVEEIFQAYPRKWYLGMNHGESIQITEADRDRIIEAMNEPTVADKLEQIDGHLGYFVR